MLTKVPWGRKELAVGLIAWAVSFVAVGLLLVPLLGAAGGLKVGSCDAVGCTSSPLQASRLRQHCSSLAGLQDIDIH